MSKNKISVSCIIENAAKILLIKEKQGRKISWDIPAGGLDLTETLEEGVKREVREETGISIAKVNLLNIFQYIEEGRTTINFLFYSRLKDPQELLPEKIDGENILDIQWFEKDEVQSLLDEGEYENNLAKARLESYLNNAGVDKILKLPKVVRA